MFSFFLFLFNEHSYRFEKNFPHKKDKYKAKVLAIDVASKNIYRYRYCPRNQKYYEQATFA